MKNRGLIITFTLTVLLAIGALYLGWRLTQEQVAPEESAAASEEVWSAEKFHANNINTYFPGLTLDQALAEFAAGWDELEASPDFSFETAKAYALGEGGRFIADQAIMTVGSETLYGNDLNYFLFIFNYQEYTAAATLSDPVVNSSLDRMIEQSLVLQVAQREGYLDSLSSDIFNSTAKNLTSRNNLVRSQLANVEDLLVQSVTFETLTLYYDNIRLSDDDDSTLVSSRDESLTKEQAKEQAQEIMNGLLEQLSAGSITMEEAVNLLLENPQVLLIDSVAEQNAYGSGLSVPIDTNPFGSEDRDGDQVLHEELRSLGEGQFSLVVQDESDTRFVIIRVTKRTAGVGIGNLEDVLQNEEDSTNVDITIQNGT
jgi:hypothetical protein